VFVLESFQFWGGQSVETAEYPFGGLWSNGRLNERPQSLRVKGYVRDRRAGENGGGGAGYIKARNALVEALRVPTDDGSPGYADLPFWGRFPVVVDGYGVSEKADEKGQCEVSIDFTRAGVSAEARAAAPYEAAETPEARFAEAQKAAAADFAEKLEKNADRDSLAAGAGKIAGFLAGALGRVRAAQNKMDTMAAGIGGITSLVAQGIRAPGELAASVFNAAVSVAAGLLDIKNAVESYGAGDSGSGASGDAAFYPAPADSSEKNALLYFLSAAGWTADLPSATPAQWNTKTAVENLCRTAALCAACLVMARTDAPYQTMLGCWKLLEKLEGSADRNSPAVYAALENLRISVSRELRSKELAVELRREFGVPLPLLCIARRLGCGEAKLREMNGIADSFAVKGDVAYV
jgi:hypothetical protein